MHRLLTFLGTGPYQETLYCLVEHSYRCRFSIAALDSLHRFDKIDVFLTTQATEHPNWVDLKSLLGDGDRVRGHLIPLGANSDELWRIFSEVCSAVLPGDEVSIDVTHGFRAYGTFAVTIADFLQSTREVTISGIYYGAYEALDPETKRTPIFNLVPQLDLIRWNHAARAFFETGTSAPLGREIQKTHARRHKEGSAPLPKRLCAVGKHLERIGVAWESLRIHELIEQIRHLPLSVDAAFEEEISREAPPCSEILREVIAALLKLTEEDDMASHRAVIAHYVRHGRFVASLSLAREWLISFAAIRSGLSALAEPPFKDRREFEAFFNSWVHTKSHPADTPRKTSFAGKRLVDLDEVLPEDLPAVWSRLSELRNDLDHAGFRDGAVPALSLRRKVEGALVALDAYWNSSE